MQDTLDLDFTVESHLLLFGEHQEMRRQVDPRGQIFSYFSRESRVPPDHSLRSVEANTERVLKELSTELDALYSETSQPSIPQERLLKVQLIALYSVRSYRPFCQMFHDHLPFCIDLLSSGVCGTPLLAFALGLGEVKAAPLIMFH